MGSGGMAAYAIRNLGEVCATGCHVRIGGLDVFGKYPPYSNRTINEPMNDFSLTPVIESLNGVPDISSSKSRRYKV